MFPLPPGLRSPVRCPHPPPPGAHHARLTPSPHRPTQNPASGRRYSPTWDPTSYAPKELVKEWNKQQAEDLAAPRPKKTVSGVKPNKKALGRPKKAAAAAAPAEPNRARRRPTKAEKTSASTKKFTTVHARDGKCWAGVSRGERGVAERARFWLTRRVWSGRSSRS